MAIIAPQFQNEDAAADLFGKVALAGRPDMPALRRGSKSQQSWIEKEGSDTHGRKGLYQCNGCRKQFTVKVGTIFSDSKIPLHKWLMAFHLMCSSKKGISALQLQRELEIEARTAQLGSCAIGFDGL